MANARGTIDMKAIKAASQQATNYIKFDNNGITVADLTNGTSNLGKNVFINSTSVNIRNGTDILSSFTGDGVYIGESDKASLSLTSSEISATTNAGVEFFNISSGTAYEEETISGSIELTNSSSSETEFSSSTSVPFDIEYETVVSFTANIGITVDGVSSTREFSGQYTYSYSEEGTIVDYGTQGITANTYSMTFRYGTVIGANIVNLNATITPVSGHTAIIDSITFDYTATSRKYQSKMYTFGTRGEESDIGEGSFTVGDYMIASSPNQFVIGKYNVEDANSVYAFIIGNGSDIGEYRSNAFAVKWSGDVETNAITLNENSLSEADNYIECVDANDTSVFKVVKSSGNTIVGGALIANSTATFNSNVIARGDLDVGDALSVGGNLVCTGTVTADGLNSTGNIRANGNALLYRSTKKYTNIGISANGAYHPTSVKDISLTGYKPIAVFGIWVENNPLASSSNADASWCVVPSYWINSENSTLNFYIWNQNTSKSVRVDIEFQVLYAADSIL